MIAEISLTTGKTTIIEPMTAADQGMATKIGVELYKLYQRQQVAKSLNEGDTYAKPKN